MQNSPFCLFFLRKYVTFYWKAFWKASENVKNMSVGHQMLSAACIFSGLRSGKPMCIQNHRHSRFPTSKKPQKVKKSLFLDPPRDFCRRKMDSVENAWIFWIFFEVAHALEHLRKPPVHEFTFFWPVDVKAGRPSWKFLKKLPMDRQTPFLPCITLLSLRSFREASPP